MSDKVEWAYMTYEEIKKAGLIGKVKKHMGTFKDWERTDAYNKYLINNCKFPVDWLELT